MKIYEIIADANNTQTLVPVRDNLDPFTFVFDSSPKLNEWVIPDMKVYDPTTTASNFYCIGNSGVLVFDEIVLESMQTMFEICGEILPINCEGKKLFALNVTECINVLDEDRTIWEFYSNGKRRRIKEYFFSRHLLSESSIFKIPQIKTTKIFCYSEVKDVEDEFIGLYKLNALNGLVFEKVFG